MLPISSRKSVPPAACSNLPGLRLSAPVKALVAEELALEERVGEGRAVHRHERPRRRAARLVHRPGDQLLAGAALAGDQHRPRDDGHALDLPHHLEDLRRLAHDPEARAVRLAQRPVLLAEDAVPLQQREDVPHLAEEGVDPPLEPPAADEEVRGARADRALGRGDVALLGHRHDGERRVELADGRDQLAALALTVAQHQVEDQHAARTPRAHAAHELLAGAHQLHRRLLAGRGAEGPHQRA